MSDATLKVSVVAVADALHITSAWAHDFMGVAEPYWLSLAITALLAYLTWHILPMGCYLVIRVAEIIITVHNWLNRCARKLKLAVTEALIASLNRYAKYLSAPEDAAATHQIVERAKKIVQPRDHGVVEATAPTDTKTDERVEEQQH